MLGSEVWSESKLQDAKKASTCDNSRADEHHLIYAHVRSLGCAKKCRPRGLSKAFSPVVSAPWDCCTLGNDKQRSLFQRLPTVGSKSFLSLCALFVPLCAYRSLYRSLSLSLCLLCFGGWGIGNLCTPRFRAPLLLMPDFQRMGSAVAGCEALWRGPLDFFSLSLSL